MRKIASLLIFIFGTYLVYAQNEHYSDLYLQSSRVESGEHKGYDRFDLGSYILYNNPKRYQAFCYIINSESGEKVFSFQDPLDSKKLEFHFFKPDSEDEKFLIFVSSTKNVSQGVYLFLLEKDKVRQLGFIEYGVDDYNFSSLGFHSLVNEVDGQIEISFYDTAIIDYKTEKVIDGNTIKFVITESSIIKINN